MVINCHTSVNAKAQKLDSREIQWFHTTFWFCGWTVIKSSFGKNLGGQILYGYCTVWSYLSATLADWVKCFPCQLCCLTGQNDSSTTDPLKPSNQLAEISTGCLVTQNLMKLVIKSELSDNFNSSLTKRQKIPISETVAFFRKRYLICDSRLLIIWTEVLGCDTVCVIWGLSFRAIKGVKSYCLEYCLATDLSLNFINC